MRNSATRLAALAAAVAAVLSCDGGPTVDKFGNGIAGGATGTQPIQPPAPGGVDTSRPFVRIDTPIATPQQLINVGDSILVVTRIIDDRKVGTLTIVGLKFIGSASLGTLQQIERYPTITAPVAGTTFRPGLVDTIIRRYLKAGTPVDTSVDSLVIMAIHTDSAGNADTTRRTVALVTGPKVTITAPVANDSVPRGIAMSVTVTAEHPTGVDSVIVRVNGEANWSPPLDTTIRVKYAAGTRNAVLSAAVTIPATAPNRGRITITARAVDVNRNPGSAPPIVVFARATANIPPRVYQTVPAKIEHTKDSSIVVSAVADGIKTIGRVILDSLGTTVLRRDSVNYFAPYTGNRTQKFELNLGLSDQGRRIKVWSFARDTSDSVGYSLAPSSSVPITIAGNAYLDTSLVTFGRTYRLPRSGTAGDIAVDEVRGNVFVSNTSYNLLEIWSNSADTFATNGVQVGAQPWGMFVSIAGANRDTLLVANSGATTISKVDMAAGTPAEVLSKRIRTRNIVNFEVTFSVDATGKVIITWDGKINSYSDRPQYVAKSEGGRIFYSTRPTTAKVPGTIRWLDPALALPDPRQIWSYGRYNTSETEKYVILNTDSIAVIKSPSGSVQPDTLRVCDHPYGAAAGDFCVKGTTAAGAVAAARAAGSDVEAVLALTLGSLALTDTSYVAASGDRKWIAFGEGNPSRVLGTLVDQGTATARIMMVNDPAGGSVPGFFSPAITVDDIQENSNEVVFGLALDTTGLQLLVHGRQTAVAAVDLPFHLRLDGLYDSFDNGAGVAFHPRAKGTSTAASADRVAFTATTSGVIEAFDVAHYNNRGRYVTKTNLYGPLRVTPPLPGDPAGVILKLYGLNSTGLIVINLQAADIKP